MSGNNSAVCCEVNTSVTDEAVDSSNHKIVDTRSKL